MKSELFASSPGVVICASKLRWSSIIVSRAQERLAEPAPRFSERVKTEPELDNGGTPRRKAPRSSPQASYEAFYTVCHANAKC